MAKIHKTKNKKLNRLQIGIFISVVTIILVSAFFFFKPQPSTPSGQEPKTIAQDESEKKFVEADKAAFDGDYQKGQSILDDALKIKTSDTGRSDIYIQKSTLAFNNAQMQDAVAFAKTAEQLDPTSLSASVLAQAAEQAGDKVLAVKYYKLAAERTTEQEKQLSLDDFEFYQSKVKELSS
ncbi:hypothetical protein H7X68_03780 [Candidatus Saccharibacteria bacterium]|nr:hypothetical protein [Candidatus Saccharibacteria bacterium]